MKALKKGFTLVELIVVITILAILGTIAFISLQGYSSDARNSKRTSDLNSLASQINIKSTEGVGILAFVTSVANNETNAYASYGGDFATVGTNYRAGTLNFQVLGMKQEEFKEPNGNDYVVGVTSKKDGKYELATKIETAPGTYASNIIGNYVSRGATSVTGTVSGNNLALSSTADIGKLFYGDVVDLDGTLGDGATGTITAISGDGMTITVSATPGTTIALDSKLGVTGETAGLIDVVGTGTGLVSEGSTANFAY